MQSKKYLDFNAELKTITHYIEADSVRQRLGISDEQRDTLNSHRDAFEALMLTYSDTSTKTQAIVEQVAEQYKIMHKWSAEFKKAVKYSKQSVLTKDDYNALSIHQDKPHSKHTVPKIEPNLSLEHINHLNARIAAHLPESHDQGTRPKLPVGVDNIDWQWVINADAKPNAELEYNQHKTSSSATLNLKFSETEVTQYCHIKARYGITNGEVGSYSFVISFAIT